MNKILLDNKSNIDLVINTDSVCNILNNTKDIILNIIIKDNVKLIINEYNEINKKKLNINIIQYNNSEFIYNHSFINQDDYKLNININMLGNKSKNTINIHGITETGNTIIKIDGKVDNNTKDNELYEKIKILNLSSGYTNVYPNMFIDTMNVIADHATSITNIDKNYLFYLNGKGINDKDAIELIKNGFLINDAKLTGGENYEEL